MMLLSAYHCRPKVYISGPMSGYPDNNRAAFMAAEEYMKGQGYDVINPARLSDGPGYCDYLAADIKAMGTLRKGDKIYLLLGHEQSTGCMIEAMIAKKLGLDILTERSLR